MNDNPTPAPTKPSALPPGHALQVFDALVDFGGPGSVRDHVAGLVTCLELANARLSLADQLAEAADRAVQTYFARPSSDHLAELIEPMARLSSALAAYLASTGGA